MEMGEEGKTSSEHKEEAAQSSNTYAMTPDPLTTGLISSYNNRQRNRFLNKRVKAEGRAGDDPDDMLGTGPREDIKMLMKPTRFTAKRTGSIRKSKTHRMIEAGQSEAAIRRFLRYKVRSHPSTLRRLKFIEFEPDTIANQNGLFRQAKDSMKEGRKVRLLDAVSV